MTRVYKEKQFLIFDFEDGRTVKYDFATKTCIGIKGKPVKGLQNQLSDITMQEIIECCSDEKYAKFLKFVQNRYPYCISNIGTILSKIPQYSKFEQIFSAGFDGIVDRNFTKTINDIPKSLIKIAKDRQIKISDRFCDYWKRNPNAHYLAYQLDYISLTDEDINKILNRENYDYVDGIINYYSYFNKLIEGKRQILMRSDTKLPQPFVSWSNSL